MSTKSISMCEGKGSLSHNNREFSAKNIDSSRTPNNVVFVQQALSDAYHQLFDEAVEKYNAMILSIKLDTLTARILKLSSDCHSQIVPAPLYSRRKPTDC